MEVDKKYEEKLLEKRKEKKTNKRRFLYIMQPSSRSS